ncbi:MAG: hypothetical protein O4965_01675 [Trichodesmium sp. St19_bin1]|nr:hypothetical protein [Trichodesmium sp. St19_bin1]
MKFRTELEIQSEDDELLVSFPSSQSTKAESQESSVLPRATLDITLTPHQGPEGLKKIVEGYEKVLRAQIPN